MCKFAADLTIPSMPETNPFIICKASAGTGKTHMLVKQFLTLAFDGPDEEPLTGDSTRDLLALRLRGILAITFTNKAVNEMKERIMDELTDMARGIDMQKDSMGRQLIQELNSRPFFRTLPVDAPTMQRRAAHLLSLLMHHYSDFSVSTIDSFMHRIVRTFAHDLDKPVNFEVMLDQQEMLDHAVEQLMSLVGTDGNEELTRVLNAFADSRMENDKGYKVEELIGTLARQLFKEDAEAHLEALSKLTLSDFREIHRSYSEANARFEARLRAIGTEMMDLLARHGLDSTDCSYGNTGFYGYFRKLAQGLVEQPGKRTADTFANGKFAASKSPSAAAFDAIAPQMQQLYGSLNELFANELVDYNTRSVLLSNLYSMALLNLLNRELEAYSRDNEVMHLSEFNRLINNIVREEPAPFIYERLGNRYRHFLIDEFQDTSILQWHNLVPLLDNGLSQGCESLVVGDGKQAIYRFRQGDVRQFVRLPEVEGLPLHGDALRRCRTVELTECRRTCKVVVDFNNQFFSWVLRHRDVGGALASDIYIGQTDGEPNAEHQEALRQVPVKPSGHVGIDFFPRNDPDAIYEHIINTIQRLHTQGYAYGDIMILARSNSDLARISTYMTAHSEVPQTSSESFYLRSSDAVMAIVSALRCVRDRTDRVASADLLHRLASLGIIAHPRNDAFLDPEGVDLPRLLREANGLLDFRPAYLQSLDLYDCCEELIRQLQLDGIDMPYVASLLNRVASFAARHKHNLGEFLDWFDEHVTLSAASPEGIDAVRLLTIHKSKGLEAPVVICPLFFGRPHPTELWVDLPAQADGKQLPTAYVTLSDKKPTRFEPQRREEQELSEVDDINILYVAMTRPREQLYLVCPDPSEIRNRPANDLRYPSLLYDFVNECHTDLGDPSMQPLHDAKKKMSKQVTTVDRLSYGSWNSKVSVAPLNEKTLTPLMEQKIRFGIYAHDLLSTIAHADEVDEAVGRFAEHVQPDEMEQLAEVARAVVQHPDSRRFFDADYQVRTECEIMCNGGVERPDRVVYTPDAVWVVDFKTGVPMEEHAEQVARYCRALGLMDPRPVEGYLVYLQPDIRVSRCFF